MAVEKGTNDATVDHPRKGLVVWLRSVHHGQAIVNAMAVNLQPQLIGGPTTKTN